MTSDWVSVAVLFGVIIGIVAVLTIIRRKTFNGSATRVLACVLGLFTGIGGASHGPGEILQGNVAPGGIYVQAWPQLTLLGGEPAITIIPNFFVTGVLTIIVGLALAAWAGWFVQRRNGGLALILLSISLLLVGGGIVPPLFGVAAGTIGTRIKQVLSASE